MMAVTTTPKTTVTYPPPSLVLVLGELADNLLGRQKLLGNPRGYILHCYY